MEIWLRFTSMCLRNNTPMEKYVVFLSGSCMIPPIAMGNFSHVRAHSAEDVTEVFDFQFKHSTPKVDSFEE